MHAYADACVCGEYVRYRSPDHTRARRVDVLGRDAGSARSESVHGPVPRRDPGTALAQTCSEGRASLPTPNLTSMSSVDPHPIAP